MSDQIIILIDSELLIATLDFKVRRLKMQAKYVEAKGMEMAISEVKLARDQKISKGIAQALLIIQKEGVKA